MFISICMYVHVYWHAKLYCMAHKNASLLGQRHVRRFCCHTNNKTIRCQSSPRNFNLVNGNFLLPVADGRIFLVLFRNTFGISIARFDFSCACVVKFKEFHVYFGLWDLWVYAGLWYNRLKQIIKRKCWKIIGKAVRIAIFLMRWKVCYNFCTPSQLC